MSRLAVTQLLGILLLPQAILAQSTSSSGKPTMFHVQGTISSPWDSLLRGEVIARSKLVFHGEQALETVTADDKDSYVRIPRTEITFQGKQVTKNVIVDDKGFYQADLPIGLYKMTARGPQVGPSTLTEYIRLFRVSSATTIVLNGALYMARTSCDAIIRDDSDEQGWKDICGAEENFPVPSKDGTPFQIYVRYPQRQHTEHGIVYDSDKIGWPGVPVFLAYNVLSLEANQVIYSPKNFTVQATGNVVIADVSGVTHADSATFKIENGQAVPVHQ